MKHKVGDKVRIRPDLKSNIEYGCVESVDEMCTLQGQIMKISEVCTENKYYRMEEDHGDFLWTDEMFEDAMTNGELVRSMSDEELADWLVEVYKNTKTFDEIYDWLKEGWCEGE